MSRVKQNFGFGTLQAIGILVALSVVPTYMGVQTHLLKKQQLERRAQKTGNAANRSALGTIAYLFDSKALGFDLSQGVSLGNPNPSLVQQLYLWRFGRLPRESEWVEKLVTLSSGVKSIQQIEQDVFQESESRLGKMGSTKAMNVRALLRVIEGKEPTNEQILEGLKLIETPTGEDFKKLSLYYRPDWQQITDLKQIAAILSPSPVEELSLYLINEGATDYGANFASGDFTYEDLVKIGKGTLKFSELLSLGRNRAKYQRRGGECGESVGALIKSLYGGLPSTERFPETLARLSCDLVASAAMLKTDLVVNPDLVFRKGTGTQKSQLEMNQCYTLMVSPTEWDAQFGPNASPMVCNSSRGNSIQTRVDFGAVRGIASETMMDLDPVTKVPMPRLGDPNHKLNVTLRARKYNSVASNQIVRLLVRPDSGTSYTDAAITIAAGSSGASLKWDTTNMVSCELSPCGQAGQISTSGTQTLNSGCWMPDKEENIYALSCVDAFQMTYFSSAVVKTAAVNIFANGQKGTVSNPVVLPYNSNPVISWQSTNTNDCTVTGTSKVGTSGSFSTGPLTTYNSITTFEVSCNYSDGLGAIKTVKDTVSIDIIPPNPTVTLTVNNKPSETIGFNGSVTLRWTHNFAANCRLYDGAIEIQNNIPTPGSRFLSGLQANKIYSISCSNLRNGFPGASAAVTVQVNKPQFFCGIFIHTTGTDNNCGRADQGEWWRIFLTPTGDTNGYPMASGVSLANWINNNANDPDIFYGFTQRSGRFCAEGDAQYPIADVPNSITDSFGTVYTTRTSGGYGSPNCRLVYGGVFSPLILDLANEGVQVTAPNEGVLFDLKGNGKKNRFSWPSNPGSSAFLALDKNKNGIIDNIDELFGDNTIGPDGKKSANGFEALIKYDLNKDEKIDDKDDVFHRLLLWQDLNYDGKTEKRELVSLRDRGVKRINLNYKQIFKPNGYQGTVTLQESSVEMVNQSIPIYDVWFVAAP